MVRRARSCSAWDAYKSIHGAEVHPKPVTEFLLFNEDFPRSVRFCAGELNTALRRISGVAEGRFVNDAEKLAGRLLAELQFSTVDEIFSRGLHRYLDELQLKLNSIGDALFSSYFFPVVRRFLTKSSSSSRRNNSSSRSVVDQAPPRWSPSPVDHGLPLRKRIGILTAGATPRPSTPPSPAPSSEPTSSALKSSGSSGASTAFQPARSTYFSIPCSRKSRAGSHQGRTLLVPPGLCGSRARKNWMRLPGASANSGSKA